MAEVESSTRETLFDSASAEPSIEEPSSASAEVYRQCVRHGWHSEWRVSERTDARYSAGRVTTYRCAICEADARRAPVEVECGHERERRVWLEDKRRASGGYFACIKCAVRDRRTVPGHFCPSHGEHDEWHATSPKGVRVTADVRCARCDAERWATGKSQRGRKEKLRGVALRERYKYRAKMRAAILTNYPGDDVLAAFEAMCSESDAVADVGARATRVGLDTILIRVLVQRHPNLNAGRILEINRLMGQNELVIGWVCASCRLGDDDPSFFDIDHVTPVHRIGKRTNADRSNLQLLCPNCHRRKTMSQRT